jgi:hypothetical protein
MVGIDKVAMSDLAKSTFLVFLSFHLGGCRVDAFGESWL